MTEDAEQGAAPIGAGRVRRRKGRGHPGTIERRGKGFRVILYAGGKRFTYQLPTVDRREAAEFAKRKDVELAPLRRRLQGGLLRERVSSLLDKYETERLPLKSGSTQDTYQGSLASIRTFFGERLRDPYVDAVRGGHILDFLNWRRTRPHKSNATVSNRTIQKDRAVLHSVFAFAEELEWRDGNPVSRVHPPKADSRSPVILDDGQYQSLLDACGGNRPMLRLYILALGETGARCESEVLHLRWEDVDFEQGFVQIVTGRDGHRTKTGKSRYVPMTAALSKALRHHFGTFRFAVYGGQPTPWVFHHLTSRRRAKAGGRIVSLRTSFLGAAARAKLPPGFHQHDLRHRRVTTWLAEGKNPVHVKEAVGHSDLRTTMMYTHLSKEHLRSLVQPDGADLPKNLPKAGFGLRLG